MLSAHLNDKEGMEKIDAFIAGNSKERAGANVIIYSHDGGHPFSSWIKKTDCFFVSPEAPSIDLKSHEKVIAIKKNHSRPFKNLIWFQGRYFVYTSNHDEVFAIKMSESDEMSQTIKIIMELILKREGKEHVAGLFQSESEF